MATNYDAAAVAGAAAGAMAISYLISLAVTIFMIVCLWKIYAKADRPGWASIIPFYNFYVLFDIAWGNGWLFLLMFVPIANIVVSILVYVKLAKAFGKSGGFAVGLIFLAPIFMAILAFGDAQYIGPQ